MRILEVTFPNILAYSYDLMFFTVDIFRVVHFAIGP